MKGEVMVSQKQKINALLTILRSLNVISEDDEIEFKKEYENSELERFEDYLIDEELIEKEDLLKALEKYYNVPAVDVMGMMFDHDLVRKFPKDVLLRNCCIPYRQDGPLLIIIAMDPLNEDLDSTLGEFVSYDFQYNVGIPRHIDMMIKEFYDEELYKESYEDIIDEEAIHHDIVNIDEDNVVHYDDEGRDDE